MPVAGQEGQERQEPKAAGGHAVIRRIVVPAALYKIIFFALTWPALLRFRTHFYADSFDGLQNVWNLWWIGRAVTVLHQNPWRTTLLHYPYGTSLVGHTLNPFNGFLAIPFLRIFTLVEVHNGIVIFAFVAAGVTAFLLAYELTHAYAASLIGGFVYTFSSFHFAHAEGHLQLVSLEWIPLFLLLWLRLLSRPTIGIGVAAALALWLVLLCDYYYFFYSAIAAFVAFGWMWSTPTPGRSRWRALGAFGAVAAATCGTLVAALLVQNARDPFTGAHSAVEFSLDALAPFIYGSHWRFGELTRPFWIRLRANPNESSVHLGFSVIALLLFVWLRRSLVGDRRLVMLFFTLLAAFIVLALGPTPQVGGREMRAVAGMMPYAWLQYVFPFLSVSGVPIRMMVMVTLSAAVLSAYGFATLWRGSRRERGASIVLLLLLLVEYLPKSIPFVKISTPGYVEALKGLPGDEGVLDLVSPTSENLAYQTEHLKPLAFGYVARVPQSVAKQDRRLEALVNAGDYDRLWPEYRLRYVVAAGRAAAKLRTMTAARTIWDDGGVGVFDVSAVTR